MNGICKKGHAREVGRECVKCKSLRNAFRKCSRCKVQFKAERNQFGSRLTFCADCREKFATECRAMMAKAGAQKCACGKTISKSATQCKPCRSKVTTTVLIHCSLCGTAYKPTNYKKSLHARVVFCPVCFRTRRAEVAKITAVARTKPGKSGGMRTTDRNINRLIAEAMGSVRTVFDRERGVGAVPANLRHYLHDKETYQLAQRRGSRAIVRVEAAQVESHGTH
jgi:hypothetical protein